MRKDVAFCLSYLMEIVHYSASLLPQLPSHIFFPTWEVREDKWMIQVTDKKQEAEAWDCSQYGSNLPLSSSFLVK